MATSGTNGGVMETRNAMTPWMSGPEILGLPAAVLKYWSSETQGKIIDECLQLFGDYGYMLEYPIARLYVDARVSRLLGGTSEIQKEIIARSLDD